MKTKRSITNRRFKALTLASTLMFALGLTACGGGSSDAGGETTVLADAACGIPNYHAEILAQINAKRASGAVCGGVTYPAVAKLTWSTPVQSTAVVLASRSAANNAVTLAGHFDQLLASGYSYSESYAIGIDYQESVQGVVDTLMARTTISACKNFMSSNLRDLGASCARSDAGVPYHVVVLGRR